MCPKSIRKYLVAVTPAGVSIHHLDSSFNSKVFGVVLAKRKKTVAWRSLRHFSWGVMCQGDYSLVKSLKSPFKEVDSDKANTEMQGRLGSHLEAEITWLSFSSLPPPGFYSCAASPTLTPLQSGTWLDCLHWAQAKRVCNCRFCTETNLSPAAAFQTHFQILAASYSPVEPHTLW